MKTHIVKKGLFMIPYFAGVFLFSQQKLTGKIMSENDMVIGSVLVFNISNHKSVYSNAFGEFVIEGSVNDELRFIKQGYERVVKKINNAEASVNIVLLRIPEEIEEVEILNLTGDLAKDSKKLTKEDKIEKLQKNIGLPRPPEVMREKAPGIGDVFNLNGGINGAGVGINPEAIYKLISGDARRMKSLYRYEDQQRYIKWIVERLDVNYFLSLGIPKDRISEFVEYAFLENPKSLDFVKAKNSNGAIFEIEKTVSKFLERLKRSTS